MTQTPYTASMAWPTDPGVGRRARMRGQSSTTFGWCTIGSAWCATNVTTTHQPHQTPSAATAGRTANPLERESPKSQPHPGNHQQETYNLSSPYWKSKYRSQGEFGFPWAAYWGHPPSIGTAPEGNQMEKVPPTNLQHPTTCFPTHLDQAAAC